MRNQDDRNKAFSKLFAEIIEANPQRTMDDHLREYIREALYGLPIIAVAKGNLVDVFVEEWEDFLMGGDDGR